ncbi:MAG: NUDIX domain-containing protein [Acidimicrobiales bacterium]|nr:NUDIX domain-containing protein [Acidimicrobiales bacterium]
MASLYRVALGLFGRLPRRFRRRVVRLISPSYTVGAMCFIERGDGALLLVRHSYRDRWGVPGGLLQRGEDVEDGVRREVDEEVGLSVELLGEPAVVVDAQPQRVDVVFRARPIDPTSWTAETVTPRSAEILEAQWYHPDQLPELQFETADALMTLARSDTSTVERRLPDPVWPRLD